MLAGAAFPPIGLFFSVPAYQMVKAKGCDPVLTDEHIVLLAKWRDAYMRGDTEALKGITDSSGLVADYAGMFDRTLSREVVYRHLESVRGGFFAEYETTFRFRDGSMKMGHGFLDFRVVDGKIVAVREVSA